MNCDIEDGLPVDQGVIHLQRRWRSWPLAVVDAVVTWANALWKRIVWTEWLLYCSCLEAISFILVLIY